MTKPRTLKSEAKDRLWALGNLSWKCHSGQQELYDLYYNSPHKIQTWLLSRRTGKSFALCVLAIEQCLKQPNSIVKFLSPTKLQVNTYLRPLMTEVLKDCPQYLKPEFRQKDYIYYFSNGSEIQLAGSDGGHAERLRGGNSHLAIIDEAGSCSDLADTIKSILLPTTLITGGKIILSGTPSKEPDHEFHDYIEQAEARGSLVKKTIDENPMLTEAQKKELFDELGGKDSDEARRELYVEIIRDPKTSVVPEFTKELEAEIVQEWKRPPHFDMYEAMDLGFKDLTACLLGYYDFRNNKVVIEDEVVIDFQEKNTTLETLIKEIKDKEEKRFFNYLTNEQKKPTKRVSDIDYIVLNEIKKVSKYEVNFEATSKDNLTAMVNFLREKLKKREIVINPRCKTLIRHLRNVKWKKGIKDEFARSADDHHYDACFLPGVSVLTKTGYKKIEDIIPGEEVLTHLGRFRKVLNVMNKDYIGKIKNIKPIGRDVISCTPDHRFYSGIMEKTRTNGFTGQLQVKKDDWISAEDLSKQNRLIIPNIESQNFNISNEMAFLYGYWVAEGCLGGNKSQIQFAGDTKEVNIEIILNKATDKKIGKQINGNSRVLSINNNALWKELRKLGKSDYKSFPEWIVNLNKEQSLYMLCGYLFGDGHFSKVGASSCSISTKIINGVDILSRKLGLVGNIRLDRLAKKQIINGRECNTKEQYKWSLDCEQTLWLLNEIYIREDLNFTFKDKLIHKIDLKNKRNFKKNYISCHFEEDTIYSGKVYNLEVEEDNSYTVNGVAVHNCAALIYLLRAIDYRKNPYPAHWGREQVDLFGNIILGKETKKLKDMKTYELLFNLKRKRV